MAIPPTNDFLLAGKVYTYHIPKQARARQSIIRQLLKSATVESLIYNSTH